MVAILVGVIALTVTSGSSPLPTVRVKGNTLIDVHGQVVRLLGVDASGTEDACVMDQGFSRGPFDSSEAKNIASWGANAVRVPLNEDCWLGINGVPSKYSGAAYRTAIKKWVSALNKQGMVVILDLHWSAPGPYEATQQWPMADADHSVTFWSQVASTFSSDPSIVFDLFNEPTIGGSSPTSADWACWLNGCTTMHEVTSPGKSTTEVTYRTAGMQQLLDAVRKAGATQPVMVGGLNWAGDPCGIADAGGNGGSCEWLSHEPKDPLHQLVASFHTYDWTACRTPSCWNASVSPVAADVPVVTGEFGEEDCSTTHIEQFTSWADRHGISYLAWSWEPENEGETSCTRSTDGLNAGDNLQLLSDWNGTPSAVAPQGAFIKKHLLAENTGRF
jgi:endoglucanase